MPRKLPAAKQLGSEGVILLAAPQIGKCCKCRLWQKKRAGKEKEKSSPLSVMTGVFVPRSSPSHKASIMANNKEPENFEQAVAGGAAEDLARATARSSCFPVV